MAKAEHWYALTTRPRSEQAACARAEHFGFKTHVPMCEKSVIANRHTKKRKLKKFPILPGVIFVGADKEITPRVLMALIEPVRPEVLLGHGDCPNRPKCLLSVGGPRHLRCLCQHLPAVRYRHLV